jgi:hypothetical protein
MPAFLRDTVAFISIAAFVATVGLWSEVFRAVA